MVSTTSLLPRLVLLLAAAAGCQEAAAFPLFYRHVAPRAGNPGVVGNIRIPAGFTKTLFSDDFSGTAGSLPAAARWTIDTGTAYPGGGSPQWGTGEVESYTRNAANLQITAAGTLLLTPVATTAGGRTTWTSARIESVKAYDFTCAVGKKLRIESRLKLGANAAASQLGIWNAFWTLGAAYRGNYQNWPAVGEVDVLESINGQSIAYETVHCGTASGGPCHESTGISKTTPFARGGWYTAAVIIDRTAARSTADWQKEKITWLLNEQLVFTLAATTVNNQAAWAALAQNAKFILFNVAVGGAFPTAVAGVTTPTARTVGGTGSGMEVDYVAVFTS
ncbi:glucan endo-1,3-beta-glucosidase A1-like protein [Niveomyces insectorum RCEF 264]|uniref:Glucan endo-1,3-beta-glucosidase A1-like protein n=1 Tax=Niveomyces insectorum RCEF 264 TaxID=1081102 RepID=A0A167VHR0_9HYPO|nr:glucan endo-1,3-beta-glucosidase A1-like protein [Niveomyces insectorum RCEF 264]